MRSSAQTQNPANSALSSLQRANDNLVRGLMDERGVTYKMWLPPNDQLAASLKDIRSGGLGGTTEATRLWKGLEQLNRSVDEMRNISKLETNILEHFSDSKMIRLILNLVILTKDYNQTEIMIKSWTKALLTMAVIDGGIMSTQGTTWNENLHTALKILTTIIPEASQ